MERGLFQEVVIEPSNCGTHETGANSRFEGPSTVPRSRSARTESNWHPGWTMEPFSSGHTDLVGRVTFSADGARIYSESEHEKLVWDIAKRATIRDAKWEPPKATTHISPDRRWFVTTESTNVVLVDLEYKNTPDEAAYRKTKARFDPLWHQEQATAAATAQNWYAATFHYALLVKNDPDQTSFCDGLQSSFQKLKSQFEHEARDLEPLLPMVVKESLKPVDDWTNSSFEEPGIRNVTWAFRETVPRWNTTGEMFEIWSSGFLGVTAHDGNQFVELNAREEGTLHQDLLGIEQDAVIEFSFAHRGRNGEDTLKLTITDLGADNAAGGGDDKELFSKEYTTGKNAWAVYDSTTEPAIAALGSKVRFAFSAVHATGRKGPENTEGNFLDAAHFGVDVVTATTIPRATIGK